MKLVIVIDNHSDLPSELEFFLLFGTTGLKLVQDVSDVGSPN